MRSSLRISLFAVAVSLTACGPESTEQDGVEQNKEAITSLQVIHDSYVGAVNPKTQDDLIPYKSGNGPGKTVYGGASTGCNVYYAYEQASAYPANGASVPVNVGYAYMTGNVNDCIALCASWTQSFTTEPSRTKFVHRQLFYYPNYHMTPNGKDWSKWYYYNMECMAVDKPQYCLPVFGKDGYLGEFTYGTTYCKND